MDRQSHCCNNVKDVIQARTSGGEQKNLLAVTEVLAGLRFDDKLLERLFRGESAMIESPVLQKWFAQENIKTRQSVVLEALGVRFGTVPDDVSAGIRVVQDEARLKTLVHAAYTSVTLEDFQRYLNESGTTN
jgi:hypothetical protein